MDKLIIRTETSEDRAAVENLTREAFWNVNAPGCDEHYLVHVMRSHEDFIPELDLVAELDGCIVGNVMYAKCALDDGQGTIKHILTFGPLSVLPQYQRKGIGKALLEASFEKAIAMGYDTIVIFGHPCNYVARGFRSCKKYNVCIGDGIFPTAMLVKELSDGALDGRRWKYIESPVYNVNPDEAEVFDAQFPHKEKEYRRSQEEFYIYSHSTIG